LRATEKELEEEQAERAKVEEELAEAKKHLESKGLLANFLDALNSKRRK